MKTIRDHIAAKPAIPDPPASATHVMVWEPYGPSRSQWALAALEASPDDDAVALLDGPPDLDSAELAVTVSVALGYPVVLSSRIDTEGEVAYYVTPAGGS
jgi:hypothetical protein